MGILSWLASYLHAPKVKPWNSFPSLSQGTTKCEFSTVYPTETCPPLQTQTEFLLLPNILKGILRFDMLKHLANMYTPNIAHFSLLHISLTLQNISFLKILLTCHNTISSYFNWNKEGCSYKQNICAFSESLRKKNWFLVQKSEFVYCLHVGFNTWHRTNKIWYSFPVKMKV